MGYLTSVGLSSSFLPWRGALIAILVCDGIKQFFPHIRVLGDLSWGRCCRIVVIRQLRKVYFTKVLPNFPRRFLIISTAGCPTQKIVTPFQIPLARSIKGCICRSHHFYCPKTYCIEGNLKYHCKLSNSPPNHLQPSANLPQTSNLLHLQDDMENITDTPSELDQTVSNTSVEVRDL